PGGSEYVCGQPAGRDPLRLMGSETMTTTTWLRAGSALVALTALTLTACAPEEAAEFQEEDSASSQQPDAEQDTDEPTAANDVATEEAPAEDVADPGEDESTDDTDVLVAEVDEPVTFEVCEEAEAADDAT